MLTDLQPHQQCASVIMRLGGAARDVCRELSQNEILFGGVMNGQQLDPISYLVRGLQARFAKFTEETRLAALMEYLAFNRLPGEGYFHDTILCEGAQP